MQYIQFSQKLSNFITKAWAAWIRWINWWLLIDHESDSVSGGGQYFHIYWTHRQLMAGCSCENLFQMIQTVPVCLNFVVIQLYHWWKPLECSLRANNRIKVYSDIRFDGKDHIVKYSKTERRCANCVKKSNFICMKCNKGLHPKDCFKTFHSQTVLAT